MKPPTACWPRYCVITTALTFISMLLISSISRSTSAVCGLAAICRYVSGTASSVGGTARAQRAVLSVGSEGTYLGATDGNTPNMNYGRRIFYGSNNYGNSDARQWINSAAAANQWWRPANKFDRQANTYNLPGFLTAFSSDFVAAAKLAGDNSAQMILRHILPNILGPILVTAMLDIGTMMMELAGLSFLGLGAQPPVAEWGNMMSGGRSMLQTYPWLVLSPGVAIFLTVVTFNLLGDTVRDYMDPKNSGS